MDCKTTTTIWPAVFFSPEIAVCCCPLGSSLRSFYRVLLVDVFFINSTCFPLSLIDLDEFPRHCDRCSATCRNSRCYYELWLQIIMSCHMSS